MLQELAASARLFGGDLGAWPAEKRAGLLQMLVHCADIGNPARALALSLKWTARIVEEQLAEVCADVLCIPKDPSCRAGTCLDEMLYMTLLV